VLEDKIYAVKRISRKNIEDNADIAEHLNNEIKTNILN